MSERIAIIKEKRFSSSKIIVKIRYTFLMLSLNHYIAIKKREIKKG